MVVNSLSTKCCITEMPDDIALLGTELELWATKEDMNKISEILNTKCEFSGLIVIGLTASVLVKCWPKEKYCELVKMISTKYLGMRFVLLGSSLDQGKMLEADSNVLNLCGQLTLRETVALLQRAEIYLGNDTGLMHMASACGCAVVEISSFAKDGNVADGISSSGRFSPWTRDALIVQPVHQLNGCVGMCQMPYAHCITQVTVEAVFEAVCRLLALRGMKESFR